MQVKDKMKQCTLSIIVPVYNATNMLRDCLDALVRQDLSQYEVICINDGSTEKQTYDILAEYEKKYAEIVKVYHIENGGVYKARKYGVSMASGTYIGFCDCDDKVETNMYQSMVTELETSGADLVICGYHRVDYDTKKVFATEMLGWSSFSINATTIGKLAIINTALWNKVYKKELLDNMMEFSQAPRIGEDMLLLLSIYPKIKKIAFVDAPLYNYYVRKGSSMNTVTIQECNKTVQAFEKTVSKMFEKEEPEEWRALVDLMAFIHLGISLPVTVSGNKTVCKEVMHLTRKVLCEKYRTWKNSDFLTWKYIIRTDKKLAKVKIMQLVYKSHLFDCFLKVYRWMQVALKKDIKW